MVVNSTGVGHADSSVGDEDTVRRPAELECADTVVSAGALSTPNLDRDLGPSPAAPDTIGRYQVRRILGKGGMGTVFSAYDPKLDRTVALKLLLRRTTRDDKNAARMLREARALAALSHPNVVSVFDVGRELAGLYIAMEQIDGPDVRVWLGRSRQNLAGDPRGVLSGRAVGCGLPTH